MGCLPFETLADARSSGRRSLYRYTEEGAFSRPSRSVQQPVQKSPVRGKSMTWTPLFGALAIFVSQDDVQES